LKWIGRRRLFAGVQKAAEIEVSSGVGSRGKLLVEARERPQPKPVIAAPSHVWRPIFVEPLNPFAASAEPPAAEAKLPAASAKPPAASAKPSVGRASACVWTVFNGAHAPHTPFTLHMRLVNRYLHTTMPKASDPTKRRLTPQQERFAQLFAAGKSATKAYMEAYGCTQRQADATANRLLKKPHVMKRIGELQAQYAKDSGITIASISVMLKDAYNLGMETKQASAASQAAMGLAKLHGLITDKSEINAVVRHPSMTPDGPDVMTEDEWLAQFGQVPHSDPNTVN
jgi:phage terminase small subunit